MLRSILVRCHCRCHCHCHCHCRFVLALIWAFRAFVYWSWPQGPQTTTKDHKRPLRVLVMAQVPGTYCLPNHQRTWTVSIWASMPSTMHYLPSTDLLALPLASPLCAQGFHSVSWLCRPLNAPPLASTTLKRPKRSARRWHWPRIPRTNAARWRRIRRARICKCLGKKKKSSGKKLNFDRDTSTNLANNRRLWCLKRAGVDTIEADVGEPEGRISLCDVHD